MSHFTTIQTQQILDLDALHDACAEMDLKLVQNANCRGYAGVNRQAPHVIKLKGPYDIAVDPHPEKDGSYGLTTDWWDGHVAKEVGIGYGRHANHAPQRPQIDGKGLFGSVGPAAHRVDGVASGHA